MSPGFPEKPGKKGVKSEGFLAINHRAVLLHGSFFIQEFGGLSKKI
jgi:hypothetical protein